MWSRRSIYSRRLWQSDSISNTDMAIDGSASKTFVIAPPAKENISITRLLFYVSDSGTFDASKWGNGIVLANGIGLSLYSGGSERDLLGYNIKTSGDLASTCYDVGHHSFGVGDEFLVARMTFTKMGSAINLLGARGDELRITVNDDMTGLANQYVIAQGQIRTK